MSSDPPKGDRPFLARWSQRKLAAAREAEAAKAEAPQPVHASQAAGAGPPLAAASAEAAPARALPPVEALTFDSDFAAFLAPEVDATLRQKALRRLFSDPRFNVMDGLDVYIDDYNKFEPMPVDLVARLRHAKAVLDPPRTRVNAHGHVEDVPPEEEASAAEEPPADSVVAPTPGDGDARIAADEVPGLPPAPCGPTVAATAQVSSGLTLADAGAAPASGAGPR